MVGTLCSDLLFIMGFNCFGSLVTGGIIGNEEADGLAGVGSKSSFCGPEPILRVRKSLMTCVTKNGCQVIIFLTGIW
jgi:hypothetical protein